MQAGLKRTRTNTKGREETMTIHEESGIKKLPASDAALAKETPQQRLASLLTYAFAASVLLLHIAVNIFTPYGFPRMETRG